MKISIVIPVRNEKKYIDSCLGSLVKQTFPISEMECLIVDGESSDGTIEIINSYIERYPKFIRLFNNPNHTTPYAINIGFKESTGRYVSLIGCHSKFPIDYIQKCYDCAVKMGIACIGGRSIPKGKTFIGECFSLAKSSMFGAGNASYLVTKKSGYVDTVLYGTYDSKIFKEIGYFDETLTRNQDMEYSSRIIKNGGKIYLDKNISYTFYVRDSYQEILKRSFNDGKWVPISSKQQKGSMKLRHYIPFIFVLSLIILVLLSGFVSKIFFSLLLIVELGAYLIADIFFASKACTNIKSFFTLLFLFPSIHIAYGLGSVVGVFTCIKGGL